MTTDPDLGYLREHLCAASLTPYPWDGEDKNIGAFRSREELVSWFGQGPGVDGEPHRDRAFYTRELAYVSRVVQPKSIVEFGTCQGIGTCLLRWLNPTADIVTVDISPTTFIPGDKKVEIGHLAKHQGIRCEYVTGASWEYDARMVDLCFIDADHSYEAVVADSGAAWRNRSRGRRWAIVWHDHNSRHPGVVKAVEEFCRGRGVELKSRADSDTVWVMGDT